MKRSFWSTIRGKLLARTLFVVLVPVLVIAGVAIASLQSLSNTADDSLTDARSTLSEEVVGSRVASVADQIARELAIFLDERVADTELWATDVGLTTAAKGAKRYEVLPFGSDKTVIVEERYLKKGVDKRNKV